jgi:hypothetical protein
MQLLVEELYHDDYGEQQAGPALLVRHHAHQW